MTWWSWGESNPRPLRVHRPRYDHSRDSGLRSPHCRVRMGLDDPHRRIFLRCQRSFTPSAVFPSCLPLLLLPGCSDQAPGIITGPNDSLSPNQIRRRERHESCRVFVCPVLESEQLRSHDPTKQPLRRNRSAPCQKTFLKALTNINLLQNINDIG